MEEDLDALKNRLIEEVAHSTYPSERSAIRDRYADTSYFIFKTSQQSYHGSFLSFGSRRSSLVSSYGNTPTFMRRSFSSNGMLEFGIEQVGTARWKDSHALPSITKEEREEEEEGAEIHGQNEEEEFSSKNTKKEILEEDKIASEISVEDDSEYNYKNRKIFQHYDLPPSRKPSLPPKDPVDENESTTSLNQDKVDNKEKIKQDEPIPLNLKVKPSISTEPLKLIVSHNSSHSNSESLSTTPILPRISPPSNILSTEESVNGLPNESNSSKDKKPFSLPESCQLERTSSMTEKTNPFPRSCSSRTSLRDLPVRSPTPPKQSPRRTNKNYKDKESVKPSSSPHSSGSSSPLPLTDGVTHSLPPLISSKPDPIDNGMQPTQPSSLPLVDTKSYSTQILDNTPLFIVEEEKDESVSPRVGIQNLASDGKLNKSFIVVHPTSESNSLGLAPISSRRKKSSTESSISSSSSATSSFVHSSSTISSLTHSSSISASQQLLNGKKSSFSQSIKSSKFITRKLSDSSSMSTSYLPTRPTDASSQVRLIKFSKSVEEGSYVSPPSTQSGSSTSNYLMTKGRIRSFPFEMDFHTDHLSDSDNFVTNNSSRLCSVM